MPAGQGVCQDNSALCMGIELGSTRIKAVLIDASYRTVASASFLWENRLDDGYWTYHLDDAWTGIRDVVQQLGKIAPLEKVSSLGISAMMHGYLAFDSGGNQLGSFRTWRNTNTSEAARILSDAFTFNIPLRWSIAHLYQVILDGEAHVQEIAFMTTLAGYVHYCLCGEKVLGIGDASGMFPIDSLSLSYHDGMTAIFDQLALSSGFHKKLVDILPTPLPAGAIAGRLTHQGALLLDPSGHLKPGISLCPPEGDAGTGMVATNSVAPRSGNVSAGTSIFAMAVLERALDGVYAEIDLVTTPTGHPVAMVHCNNCTSDLDSWVRLFEEVAKASGTIVERSTLYAAFYRAALQGDADGGGLVSYNFISGEPLAGLSQGRPLLYRLPDSNMNLGNFARTLIYAAIASLHMGMELLLEKENLKLDILTGHGGLFTQPLTGQQLLADALSIPVAVTSQADEGGAWGIALLVAYMELSAHCDLSLDLFLAEHVFATAEVHKLQPDPEGVEGFRVFMERYRRGLVVAAAAVENLVR
ncbi:MAG: FGGY-family carbohydrate kinase [Symbiobacteriaceae bacterium]|nr:FGGY-family carbohydrate kinase [Symbiobacteriaceae bacterium]